MTSPKTSSLQLALLESSGMFHVQIIVTVMQRTQIILQRTAHCAVARKGYLAGKSTIVGLNDLFYWQAFIDFTRT